MGVSNRDRNYFTRLGAFKLSSHTDVAKDHHALPLAERLARSWELFETYRETTDSTLDDSGSLAFYKRARALGLIRR